MSLKIHEHLFEIYPSMPKYAADPSESDIIRTYDHIMLRFAGHYGRQPEYFIKSPLSPIIFGDSHSYIDLPTVAFNSSQNIIIAISKTSTKKIRLNHYQTTLYGQLQLSTNVSQWKFNQTIFEEQQQSLNSLVSADKLKNQQHNLIVKILKVFTQLNQLMEISGLDILVYKDFVQEEYLFSKQAFVYGLYAGIHTCLMKKIPLDEKILTKAFQKIADSTFTHVQGLPQLFHASYNNFAQIANSSLQKPKTIEFPKGLSLIIANTLTPLAQKLTKGKRFNLRECQVQIGIELIKSQLGIIKEIHSIKELMQSLECNIQQMLETIDSVIPTKPLSAEKIESLIERPLIEVLKHIPYANNVIDENTEFHPYNRLKFFLQEQSLIEALLKQSQEESLQNLMKVSSLNAQNLLSCSSQQIEEIQKIVGEFQGVCKIIGNGWGGCVAILCKQQLAQKLQKQLIQRFYLAPKNKILLGDEIQVYIKIVGKPQVGLAILDPTNEIWFG